MNCQWLDYDIKECGSRPIAENRQHSTKLLTPLDTHTHMWGHTHTHTHTHQIYSIVNVVVPIVKISTTNGLGLTD